MAKLKLHGRSVDVNDIWARITCPNCGHTYDVQMKGQRTFKTCRCSKITIGFKVSAEPGALVITAAYVDNTMESKPLTIDNVYIDTDK